MKVVSYANLHTLVDPVRKNKSLLINIKNKRTKNRDELFKSLLELALAMNVCLLLVCAIYYSNNYGEALVILY